MGESVTRPKVWKTPKNRSNGRSYTRDRDLTAFMLSTCVKLFQWWRYFGLCSTQVPHTYSVYLLLPSHEYLSRNRHWQIAQMVVCKHGIEIWPLLCSQLVSNWFNDGGIMNYAPHRYPTHNCRLCTRDRDLTAFMLSTCAKVLQWRRYFGLCSTQVPHTYSVSLLLSSHVYLWRSRHPKNAQMVVHRHGTPHFTVFMMWTCVKLLQWCRHFGLCSTQVTHIYSVSQLLPSHVYLWRNRHRKILQNVVCAHGLKFSLLCWSQLVSKCFNDGGILDCAPLRSPHIFDLAGIVITCVLVKE